MSGLVVEMHDLLTGPCDVNLSITDEGEVLIVLKRGVLQIEMNWDDFREIIDFVAIHGLSMKNPYLVEYEEIKDGAPSK